MGTPLSGNDVEDGKKAGSEGWRVTFAVIILPPRADRNLGTTKAEMASEPARATDPGTSVRSQTFQNPAKYWTGGSSLTRDQKVWEGGQSGGLSGV